MITVAFGLSVFSNVFTLFHPIAHPAISDASLKGLLVYEIVILSALSMLLRARGWSLQRIGFAPSLRETAQGIGLALLAYAVYVAMWFVVAWIYRQLGHVMTYPRLVAPGYSLGTAIVISAINPMFEEIFLCGYIISALKGKYGQWTAINISVAIRLACHMYQGVLAIIGPLPFGLLFGYWYARRGRLWPLVVAHSIVDLVGLLYYSAH